jgi:hypothetical protein
MLLQDVGGFQHPGQRLLVEFFLRFGHGFVFRGSFPSHDPISPMGPILNADGTRIITISR